MSESKDNPTIQNQPQPQPQPQAPVYYVLPQQPQQQSQPWKPEEVNALLERLLPYADKLVAFLQQKSESEHKLTRLATQHDWRTNVTAYGFLSIVIGLMSWLTYVGKVSGDALLFLAGTATGYIFTMISKFRMPSTLVSKEEDET